MLHPGNNSISGANLHSNGGKARNNNMVQVLLEKHSVDQKQATGKKWKENNEVRFRELYLCLQPL